MWRYVVGGVAGLLMIAAGWLLFNGEARPDATLPIAPSGQRSAPPPPGAADDVPLPEAPAKDREQKRFDRYDRDRDSSVTRSEYLEPRRKAFAKLDKNGDGRLSFEEWAIRTTTRFTAADADKSGAMTAAEFATTAPRRRATPACRCPAPSPADD